MLSDEDWAELDAGEASWVPAGDCADRQDVAGCYARCFATTDGRRVLAHLRRVAFGRMFGPDASEAVLRHAEGQKQLVAFILSFVRSGSGREP